MVIKLNRRFEVACSSELAWQHLARVERWPSWARHIKSIEVLPAGEIGPDTTGVIRLRNGIRSSFVMRKWNPGRNWFWSGKFLWLRVDYDHVFEAAGADKTTVSFVIEVEGFASGSLGRLFRLIYAHNLDRAIPHLIEELAVIGRA